MRTPRFAAKRRGAEGEAGSGGTFASDGIAHGLATLLLGNAVAAAIGFAQSLVVVRALGVADYGVYGILGSAAAICTNAVDPRLGDATMRRFYGAGASTSRAGDSLALLLAGAIAQAILAVVLGVAIVAAALAVRAALPGTGLATSAIVAFAASEALTYAGRFLMFSLRFAQRPAYLAACEVVVVAARAAVVTAAVLVWPSLEGLMAGLAGGALASLGLAAVAFVRLWVGAGPRTTSAAVRREIRGFYGRRRELFALGTTNYQNLLHRGADVLVLGVLAGEREAGLYKLARSATDALYVLYDAAAKVLQPLFMQLLAEGAVDRLRRFARRAAGSAAVGVATLLAVEAMLLEPLVRAVFGESFVAASSAIAFLTASAFFVFGLQLWAWPLVVSAGEARAYAATAFVAVAVGQYGVGLAGLLLSPGAGATWFAFSFLAADVLLWTAFGPHVATLLRGAEMERLPVRAAGASS
jgi:O-antigen/teichoic acid export membrane protein